MTNRKLYKIKESVYLSFCVFDEVVAALVVGGTIHYQTTFLASVVCLVPLG
jgi:ABC-type tungstate transport system substrate-binding protein